MIRAIGEKILGAILMLCVICGIILMMCECEDMQTQVRTLLGGLALFLIGILPGLFMSAKEWIREHG